MYKMYRNDCIDDGSDVHRGKVTSMLLPQEDRLERFISNLTIRDKSWRTTKKNAFGRVKRLSVCKWRGVTCDASQQATKIIWTWMKLQGTLQWDYLPESVFRFDSSFCRLTGPVFLVALPPRLTYFNLERNIFIGELNLSDLPRILCTLWLNDNKFDGSVDLTLLPCGLEYLYLRNNQLSGAVDLSHLPTNLRNLDLSSNRFTGPLSLQHLPALLTSLECQQNSLSGLVLFDCLSENLRKLSLYNNKDLYGEIKTSPNIRAFIDIRNTGIRFQDP